MNDTNPRFEAEQPPPVYEYISDKGKRYNEEQRGDNLIRVFEDGTEYDLTAKKLIHPPHKAIINTENAAEFRLMRAEQERRRKQDAIRNGGMLAVADKRGVKVEELPEHADAEAIGYHLMARVQDKYSANGVAAAKQYMEARDMMPDKRQVKLEDKAGNSLSGSPEALERVLAAIAGMKASGTVAQALPDDVVDGEASEAMP